MTFTTALFAFAFIPLLMVGFEITFTYATKGFAYGFSSNRSAAGENSAFMIRIKRALANTTEAAAYGVPILAVAALTDLQSESAELAALLFVIGRAAYTLLYYSGIPFIRVPAFALGTLSIFYIAYVLGTSGLI